MEPLKLAVFDAEDLAVVSAHLQDAVLRVADLSYLPTRRRFGLVARRFDWEADGPEPRRRLTGLHFESVTAVRRRGFGQETPDQALNLLAVTFRPGDAPAGIVELAFSGDATVQVDVDYLEAQMRDLGPVWSASGRPAHDRGPA